MKQRIVMAVYNDLTHDARVYKEARTLADAGFFVGVVGMRTYDSAPLEGWEGIRTTRLCVGPWGNLRVRYVQYWIRLFRRLLTLRPDVIHAHDLDVLPPCRAAATILGVPLVHDAHELWTELATLVDRPRVRAVWSWLADRFIPQTDGVITVCDGIADILHERHGVNPIVLRNMPLRQDLPEARPLREEIGIDEDTPLLIYQGGMLHGVGVDRCIEVMEHLPEAHLFVIGGGPLRPEFVKQAQASPASRRITMHEAVPFSELLSYTAAADLGLFLGESDGLSIQYALTNKFFEYVQAGVPVVVTDYPEHASHVNRYGVGMLVKPGSTPRQTADVIRQALAQRNKLARKCLDAREELVWQTDAKKLVELYRNLDHQRTGA